MSYAFVQNDVPATEEMYRQIRADLGDEPPAGLIVHLALQGDGGLRYVDVWESQEAWQGFRDAKIEPAVDRVLARFGIPRPAEHPASEVVHVVDVWLGATVHA